MCPCRGGPDLQPPAWRGQKPSLGPTACHLEKQEQNPGLLLSGLALLPGHRGPHEPAEAVPREHEFKRINFLEVALTMGRDPPSVATSLLQQSRGGGGCSSYM